MLGPYVSLHDVPGAGKVPTVVGTYRSDAGVPTMVGTYILSCSFSLSRWALPLPSG